MPAQRRDEPEGHHDRGRERHAAHQPYPEWPDRGSQRRQTSRSDRRCPPRGCALHYLVVSCNTQVWICAASTSLRRRANAKSVART